MLYSNYSNYQAKKEKMGLTTKNSQPHTVKLLDYKLYPK